MFTETVRFLIYRVTPKLKGQKPDRTLVGERKTLPEAMMRASFIMNSYDEAEILRQRISFEVVEERTQEIFRGKITPEGDL